MYYLNTVIATFLSRSNRFIAHVELHGETIICHVKTTGRCKELLLPGSTVILNKSDNPNRKTQYDLIAVYSGDTLINIDSQVPNPVFSEWVKTHLFLNITKFKPEYTYKNSRFDFYLEADGKRILVEVKGVTLFEGDVGLFPDAPTERGVKHIKELTDAVHNGYEAYVVFVAQRKNVRCVIPNDRTHKEFGETLKYAISQGVHVLAVDCDVTEDSIVAMDFVEVRAGL